MAQELMIPGGDNKLSLPAHITARFKPEDSNIMTGDRTPSLSIKGKVFTISADGETTPLMRQDDEGNEYPLANLPVVILDYAAKPGRSYYKGAYDPNEVKEPDCWSLDSVTPEAAVPEPQNPKCAGCPMSVKGSTVNDSGKPGTACRPHRILAVVPAKRLDLPPMRLRLAQTSMYDGRSPELKAKGQFAFQNYLDTIKARGIPHTQSVVTALAFDPSEAYPKLTFKAVRYVNEAEVAKIDAILASGKIDAILGDTSTVAAKAAPALPKPVEAKALPKPAPAAAVVPEDDDEAELLAQLNARRAAKAAAAAAAAQPEEDEETKLERQLAEAKAKKVAAAKAAADAEAKAKAEAEARARAVAEAKAKLEAEAAAAAAAAGLDEDDEEAQLMAKLAAAKARKAAANGAAAPAAEPAKAAAEPAKRTRRTKEQIAADEAAKALAAAPSARTGPAEPDQGEKLIPGAIDTSGLGDDDDGSDFTPTAEPVAAAAKPKPGTKTVTPAVPAQVPADVQNLLVSWED